MNPDHLSAKVLVASTPETQQEETVLADATQASLPLASPKSVGYPQSRLGVERDEGVEQALGPVSQMDPPPRPSSFSALPAQQPLRLQSSPPQSTQSQSQPYPSLSQINQDSNPKSSGGISSVSGILDPEQHSLASAKSDSQPFRYDKSIDTDVESQEESQFQPTQLDSQSTPHTDSTDDGDSSMDTVGDKSRESTRDERSQGRSSRMGESSGRKTEEQQEEDEQRPKKKRRVSFLPSSHPVEEEEEERSNPAAGTPLVRTTSKVLVAETPQRNTPPVSPSPSSSSTSQAGPSGFADKSTTTPLAVATRPSSPLSSAPAFATAPALRSHGSLSSDSTVRREPPSIARKEPSLILGSQGPPSPTQSSSSSRPSVPAPQRPSPLLARPSISQGSHQRPPRSPFPRSSSLVPETQPAAAASPPPLSNRFGSTGSTTTIPATASNPSGTSSSRASKKEEEEDELIDELDTVQDEDEEDQQSNFGNSDQEQNSGERARQAWLGKQGKSLYGPAEKEKLAKQKKQKEREKAKGKGREKLVEEQQHQQQKDNEDEVEDFSNLMDNHDIPNSSMPHQAPRAPTPPRRRPEPTTSPIASPQSSDPLAAAYVSQRPQIRSLPPSIPSTAPQTKNAMAGPSKPTSKTHLNIHLNILSPPVPLQYTPPSLVESQSQELVVVVPSLSQLDEESQMLPLGLGGGGMEIDNDADEDDMAESNLPLAMQVPAKRRVSEIAQEDEGEGENEGVVSEQREGKRIKISKESKGKGEKQEKEKAVEEEEEEEIDTPAKSRRGSDRGRGAVRGDRGGKRGASAAATTKSKPPSTTSKSTTATTTSRNHLARTPARAPAPIDGGMEDSDDETIEDADDSTWEAGPSKPKKKALTSSKHARTEEEDEDEDEDEEHHASRTRDEMEVDDEPQQEHSDEEPESLAPPPKRSPAKKTPYGSKGKSRGLPPPPPPLQLNNARDKRRRSISDSNGAGSPAPSLPANAEAGPSRRGGVQLPSNASSSRVFAPWGKGKSYYPATVTELTSKDDTYAIEFDDDDTGTAVLSALRRCIFRTGDIFTFDRSHYVVAKDQEDGEALQKGDTIRSYKKGESAKEIKEIPIELVLVQASYVDQFSDRTVVASDLLLRPSTSVRGGTRASTRQPSAIPSSVISSSNSNINSTNNKGRGKGKGRARANVDGIAFPTGRGSFQGIGFVLTNCSDPDGLKKTILLNGGTVGQDIHSFWSIGGVKSAARMRDQEYESEELKWNEALGKGELKNVLLVADEPSRKPKMMKATALGVPCVSRKWIEIARAEKTVGWLSYLLPKPRSYHNERDEVQTQAILDAWGKDPNVLYDPVNYSEHRERPLDGQKILCLLKTDAERELVAFSSLAMGAASVILETNPDDIDFDSADIFVLPDGEKKLPKILAKNSHKTRIVDVEWVYQTVLHGQRRKEQPMKKLLDDLLAKEAEAIAAAAAAKEAEGGSSKKGKKGGR